MTDINLEVQTENTATTAANFLALDEFVKNDTRGNLLARTRAFNCILFDIVGYDSMSQNNPKFKHAQRFSDQVLEPEVHQFFVDCVTRNDAYKAKYVDLTPSQCIAQLFDAKDRQDKEAITQKIDVWAKAAQKAYTENTVFFNERIDEEFLNRLKSRLSAILLSMNVTVVNAASQATTDRGMLTALYDSMTPLSNAMVNSVIDELIKDIQQNGAQHYENFTTTILEQLLPILMDGYTDKRLRSVDLSRHEVSVNHPNVPSKTAVVAGCVYFDGPDALGATLV